MRVLLFIVSALLALAAGPAQAAFSFGAEETLHSLADVGVVGAEGEALALGYKTTTQNFLLPYTISDDGYVLVVKDDPGKYYSMTDEEVAAWQESGLLPDPLPAYEVPLVERILGYLLWPTLVVIGLVYGIAEWAKRRKAAAAAGGPGAA